MDDLTKEQRNFLISLYKEVLSRQPALPFDKANYFQDSDDIAHLLNLDCSSEHVSDLCWRLYSKGYLYCEPGDDLASSISLTDETIIYMENRFKNGVKSLLDYLSKIR